MPALSAYWTTEELDAASGGRASAAAHERYRTYWEPMVLRPLRRAMGFPIVITSADRKFGGPAHQQGDASALDLGVAGNDPAKLERMFQHLALHNAELARGQPHQVGAVIHERDHIHLARPGPERWAGYGRVLREPKEGQYVLASFGFPPAVALPFGVSGLLPWPNDEAPAPAAPAPRSRPAARWAYVAAAVVVVAVVLMILTAG